jgi:hypothetical protein
MANEGAAEAPGDELQARQDLRASHEDRDVKLDFTQAQVTRPIRRIDAQVRSGNVTARPPRRNLWAWLRRALRPYALP